MTATIDMASKVDIYVRTPGYLGDDLDTQLLAWDTKLIGPYSECYRKATLQAADRMAKAQAAHAKAQEEAQKMVEVGMALTFFVIDIFTAAALSKVAGAASRLKSKQPLDTFIATEKSAGVAVAKYLSQPDTFADTIIGDIASKSLSGLTAVGMTKLKEAMNGLKAGAAATTPLSSMFAGSIPDPEAFRSALMEFYKSRIHDMKVANANGIRDNDGMSPAARRAAIVMLVTSPLCRAPMHRFPDQAMIGFVEPLLWLARSLELQRAAASGFGHWGGGEPGLRMRIAQQINQAMRQQGQIITNRGVELASGALTGMEWDGHVGPYHVAPMRNLARILAAGLENVLANMGP